MMETNGASHNGAYRQFGSIETLTGVNGVTLDLQFRMATNGVICNTLVNGVPIITTPAGSFR
jgi:hypothetical protein